MQTYYAYWDICLIYLLPYAFIQKFQCSLRAGNGLNIYLWFVWKTNCISVLYCYGRDNQMISNGNIYTSHICIYTWLITFISHAVTLYVCMHAYTCIRTYIHAYKHRCHFQFTLHGDMQVQTRYDAFLGTVEMVL